jgi:catechol 2,3-dioxygenase-like lactoylglutathione lyase family enzyme
MLRFEHVGVVVEDLDAAADFFLALGFEQEGRMTVDCEVVDRIDDLDGVRAELAASGPRAGRSRTISSRLVPLAAGEPAEGDQADQSDDQADPEAPHDHQHDADDHEDAAEPDATSVAAVSARHQDLLSE